MGFIQIGDEIIHTSQLNVSEDGKPLIPKFETTGAGQQVQTVKMSVKLNDVPNFDESIPYPTEMRMKKIEDLWADAYVSKYVIKSRSGSVIYKPELFSNPYTNAPFMCIHLVSAEESFEHLGYYACFLHEIISGLSTSANMLEKISQNYPAMQLTHGYNLMLGASPYLASRIGHRKDQVILDLETDVFYGIAEEPTKTSTYFPEAYIHIENYYTEMIPHSDEPNAHIEGNRIVALRDIKKEEVITLDLSKTELPNSLRYNSTQQTA